MHAGTTIKKSGNLFRERVINSECPLKKRGIDNHIIDHYTHVYTVNQGDSLKVLHENRGIFILLMFRI